MSDGDVVENEAELLRSFGELGVDPTGHNLSLGDQLAGVEFGNNGFQHLYIVFNLSLTVYNKSEKIR